MFWGLSPALDLIGELKKLEEVDGSSVVNILLIGSTDARHILKTISMLKRHSTHLRVNFYVADYAIELVVRQIILLTIALEPSDKIGPQEKAKLWMELYGNTLVRASTAKYALNKAAQLHIMATDQQILERRMPLLELNLLRFVEKDCLEETALFYQRNMHYPINKLWDFRLREDPEDREDYDYRFKIFDLDYCIGLAKVPGGHRVCRSEYIHWRSTGIAFTWLETEFSVGNPTLAVGIGCSGDELFSHGYVGDMESGPYFAFGTTSEEKQMLEVRDGYNLRRATDITERNLQRMFYELEHGSPPTDLYTASVDLGLVMMKPGIVDVEKDVGLEYEPPKAPEDYSAIAVPNCKVYFLPGNAMELYPKKAKYKEFFDIVYVAQNFFKFLNADIISMAKPSGCLVLETRKFVINLHKEIGQFGKEVRQKLKDIGWEEVTKCHFCRDDHVLCRKSTNSPRQDQKELSDSEELECDEPLEVDKGVAANNREGTGEQEENALVKCGEKILDTTEGSIEESKAMSEVLDRNRLKSTDEWPVIDDTESAAESEDSKITGNEDKQVLAEKEKTVDHVISLQRESDSEMGVKEFEVGIDQENLQPKEEEDQVGSLQKTE